jgi:hypothetical protein
MVFAPIVNVIVSLPLLYVCQILLLNRLVPPQVFVPYDPASKFDLTLSTNAVVATCVVFAEYGDAVGAVGVPVSGAL